MPPTWLGGQAPAGAHPPLAERREGVRLGETRRLARGAARERVDCLRHRAGPAGASLGDGSTLAEHRICRGHALSGGSAPAAPWAGKVGMSPLARSIPLTIWVTPARDRDRASPRRPRAGGGDPARGCRAAAHDPGYRPALSQAGKHPAGSYDFRLRRRQGEDRLDITLAVARFSRAWASPRVRGPGVPWACGKSPQASGVTGLPCGLHRWARALAGDRGKARVRQAGALLVEAAQAGGRPAPRSPTPVRGSLGPPP